MFNWLDKFLVKIAKKILNKYAPTGEFIAYINEQEEKVLKKLGGYGQPINETGIKSFKSAWEYLQDAKDYYDEHKETIDTVVKVGTGAAKSYIDYKDQKRKNEMTEKAYNDYMAQVEAAGHEAQAAVDLNLMPMAVSNVPTTKADVTDFTAVGAKGGLMTLPNRQRKRYALGTPDEFEVETMEEESLTPFDLQQETGLDLSGEQAKYDQGSPRKNAAMIWGNMETGDKEPYNFDFDIFFQSGDWIDMIKSEIGGGGDTQVASAPNGEPFMMEEFLQALQEGFKGSYQDYLDQIDRIPSDDWGQAPSAEGIMQAAKGGRIGYAEGSNNYLEYVKAMKALGKQPMSIDIFNSLEGTMSVQEMVNMGSPSDNKAHGGRVKRAPGGIMDLGGMEKDYRTTGGFVPLGGRERADDVPARLSKNEFVMTADAVRAAGGGSINRGAQRMYDTMKHLEARPTAKRMTA